MQLTSALISSLLMASSAMAAPAAEVAERAKAPVPGAFNLMSLRSASPIHFGTISANGGSIWIGKPTSSYCPLEDKAACPPGNVTTFAGGKDTLSMDVVVPGGQQVYVAKNGAVGYTQAHSASKPAGSTVTGFHITAGPQFASLSHDGGFLACPAGKAGVYQVFVDVAGFDKSRTDCLGFDTIASKATEPGAWQY